MTSPLTYIVVLTWNGWDDTAQCLQSLASCVSDATRVLVVDNGSGDGTPDRIRRLFPGFELIENRRNLGFPGGNNVGIRHALDKGAEYVILLNNDTVVDREFARELLAVAERDPGIGMVTSKIYFHDRPQVLWFAGGDFSTWAGRTTHAGYGRPDRGQFDRVEDIGRPCGCSLLLTRKFLEDVGLMDEDLFLYGEEIDWVLRARAKGYRCVLAPRSKVWHKVSAGMGGRSRGDNYYYAVRNTLRNLQRHAPMRISTFRSVRLVLVASVFAASLFTMGVDKRSGFRSISAGVRDYLRGSFGERNEKGVQTSPGGALMGSRPQTAIRGVFSVGLTNLAARIVAYGKHIAITALIGLSGQLDAFYMATTVLAIAVFVFGDLFDSAGIPRLVRTLRSEGVDRYRNLAGSILTLAFSLAGIMVLFLLLASPLIPLIAPGFTEEKKGFLLKNLLYLAPMAVLYLPYHAVGSFLRARRRFQAFYLGELLIALVTLGIVVIWHDFPYVIPLSFSAAYVAAFLYVAYRGREEVVINLSLRGEAMRDIMAVLFRLLPLYLTGHLFALVDRVFASFLPTGGVSALAYGMMIVMIPGSILMMESVFITPLSESEEKGEMTRRILVGVLIISVPMAFFATAFADDIVRVAFERGVFTVESTRMTADALRYLAFAIPAFLLGPIFYRLFQVLGKLNAISAIALATVAVNALLNFVFMKLGFGIKGLALATSLSWYLGIAGYVALLRRYAIHAATGDVARVLLIAGGASMLALGASLGISFLAQAGVGPAALLLRLVVFLGSLAVLYGVVPNREVQYWRETVLTEILPLRK